LAVPGPVGEPSDWEDGDWATRVGREGMYGQMAALEGDLPIAAASVAIAVDGARPAVESYGRGRVQPVSLQLCQESFAYHGDGNGEVQLFSNEHLLIEPRRRGPPTED
jgi:hypothetical protein